MTRLRPRFSLWRLRLLRRWLAPSALALVGLLPGRPAAGTTALEGLTISASGSCPSARAIEAALADMIPPGQDGALSAGVRVAIAATRDSYRVLVITPAKQADKTYVDSARDCDKRARVAAVFVFLTVMPPEFWGDAVEETARAAPSPEPIEPDAQAPDSAERRASLVRLELGGLVESAPAWGMQPAVLSGGLELRTVLGRGPIGAVLSAGYAPAAHLKAPGLGARLWRAPANVGARWRIPWDDLWLGVEGTVHAQLQGVEATTPLQPNQEAVLRWGTRWGVTAGASWSWASPFVALHATVLVDRRELVVLPRGIVAELPQLWLGGTIGMAFEL